MRKLLLPYSYYMDSYPARQIENNEKITGNCACITGSLLCPFDLFFSSFSLHFSVSVTLTFNLSSVLEFQVHLFSAVPGPAPII